MVEAEDGGNVTVIHAEAHLSISEVGIQIDKSGRV